MKPETTLSKAQYPDDLDEIKDLFLQYQQEIQADLCFQSFQQELDSLPGKYAEPRGAVILARVKGQIAGVVALRPMEEIDICEMKRLYVKPEFKGKNIGKQLARAILKEAAAKGYRKMRLDTLDRLVPAVKLYTQLGFQKINAYYPNPLEGVIYMEKSW